MTQLLSDYSIIRVTLNTGSDTLQQSFFPAHAIEWIIVNVVLLESWFAKVHCIHLLTSLSSIFQQQKSLFVKDVFQMILWIEKLLAAIW